VLRRANLAQAGDEKDLRIPSYSFFHMFNLFLAVFPEIFLINATLILLIHGVVFSTSKKYDYPPLASNVGWLGLLSVLITMLLLAAGAPLLTIAHFFWNHFLRKDDFTYFCQIFLLLS